VRVLTRPQLEHVVIWTPVGEEFFCFEPINHATDSFNVCKLHPLGMKPVVLNPDESFEQAFTFIVRHL